jgi:hypothetical protein
MLSRKLTGRALGSLVGVGLALIAASSAEAAMSPSDGNRYSTPDVHMAWCAVGAHIGPIGGCIGGPGYGPGWRRHCWINHWGRRVCN